MAPPKEEPTKKPGFLHYFAIAFVAVTLSWLAISLFLVMQPQPMHDIDGMDPAAGTGRDVSTVLRESQQRQTTATLTEEEINLWLARTVEANQGGILGMSLKFERVAVRLSEELVEVVMVRELAGRPFTVSMFISVVQNRDGDRLDTEVNLHAGSSRKLPPVLNGGRFGRLIVPQGFLRMIRPSYITLAEALREELDNGFTDMTVIKIEDKKITLDPRKPRRASTARPGELDFVD